MAPFHQRVYYKLRIYRLHRGPLPARWVPIIGWRQWSKLWLLYVAGAEQTTIQILESRRAIRLRLQTTDLQVVLQVYEEGEVKPPVDIQPVTILDAGSNVGITVAYFLDVFSDAVITALEPDPENIAAFRRNVQDPRISLVEGALWDTDARLIIANPETASWARQVCEADGPGPGVLQAYTLDALAAGAGVDYFDVLKIDIEGAEARILVDEFRPHFLAARMVFIEAHGVAVQRQADAFLCSCGFTLVRQGDMTVGFRAE